MLAAASVRATVIGKPAAAFFRQAIRAPARQLGMAGVLVRTGKPVDQADEAPADVVVDSVADLRKPIARSDSGPDDSRLGP